jgi:hypothetical protein
LIIAGRLPDLGAGSRRFKSSRPDQSPFETKLRKETATATCPGVARRAKSEAKGEVGPQLELFTKATARNAFQSKW